MTIFDDDGKLKNKMKKFSQKISVCLCYNNQTMANVLLKISE